MIKKTKTKTNKQKIMASDGKNKQKNVYSDVNLLFYFLVVVCFVL